jgi:hypothetical protein
MKKMHAISGNKQFMTKRAIPLLRKYGIQKSRANLIGGKTLELRFLIDDDKLERINKELKKMNRTAYDGIMEQLRKIIKEELNEVFGQMTIGDLRYHLKKSSLDNPVWVEVRGNAYMIKGVRIDKKRNMTFIQVQ